MSAPGSASLLAPAATQLPVAWYFDEAHFSEEMRCFFAAGPGYAGHALMVPEPGHYRTMEWRDHGRMLLNAGDLATSASTGGIWSMSNICRHRQAIMLQGSGLLDQPLVCPIHRWTYDAQGSLIGAPHFPQNPCLQLDRQRLENWRGLLFAGPRSAAADLADLAQAGTFDFSGYVLDRVVMHECNYNWKTFIEVYLEDYHVAPFHPGLGHFVSCDDLSWQMGEWYSVQRVGLTALQQSGSPAYARWQQAVRATFDGELPAQGAVWLTYFPNVMVEWYPGVLVVSSLIPRGVGRTTNVVEFYYPEEIALFEREFVAAQQAAYMETAMEDDEIGERMDRGRRALWQEGRNEVGPYQSPLEDGMQHFHEFYRRELSAFAGQERGR